VLAYKAGEKLECFVVVLFWGGGGMLSPVGLILLTAHQKKSGLPYPVSELVTEKPPDPAVATGPSPSIDLAIC
jgi:hypothetical protein